jgi:hypothetical protein
METLMACISASGRAEKRPPHMAWPFGGLAEAFEEESDI